MTDTGDSPATRQLGRVDPHPISHWAIPLSLTPPSFPLSGFSPDVQQLGDVQVRQFSQELLVSSIMISRLSRSGYVTFLPPAHFKQSSHEFVTGDYVIAFELGCSSLRYVDVGVTLWDVSDKPMPRGEIVVGDNSVTASYFNNQAKTNEVYKRNGTEQAGVKYIDFSELCENGDAVNEVQQSLTKAAKLENFEIPAKIKLLPEPWTSESGLAQLLTR
ncbi:hypothetical protein F2Q68_00026427 [Brassica cretica]|uniref:Uncharacterized protein n=1 Tax=Brassica cretica TaxID=69181 RepID=A0A8S9IJ71_BRACR|nr:hypothetical protein F2Q68_00026427 [Brassica cretica]